MFLWIWINVQIQFKKNLASSAIHFQSNFTKISTIFHFSRDPIHSNRFEIPKFTRIDRLAPTLNLDLAHLTKITYTHTVIHHLSRSNSSTIIALFSREKRVSACVPRWTCSIIPLALKFIQYGRTASLDTFLLLLKTFVHLVPFIVRVAWRCDAMHDTSVPHFLRVFIKTDDEHGERKSRASRERLLKKGLLERSTTTTTGTTATTNDRRRPTDWNIAWEGTGTPVPPRSINLN